MHHSTNPSRKTSILLLSVLATLGPAVIAPAAPLVVKTVPWVATNMLSEHDTFNGQEITLKGTCDQEGPNIRWTWDFGDTNPPVSGTVTDRYAIEAKHIYYGTKDFFYTAKLIVTDTSTGQSASNNYYVGIRDVSDPKEKLKVEVNIAIDEGLWYLHKSQSRSSSGGVDYGDWTQSRYGGRAFSSFWAVSAINANAFGANGHKVNGDTNNPYVETVERSMRRLFTWLQPFSISAARPSYAFGTNVNPDFDGNDIGILVDGSLAGGSYPGYQTGVFMDAIIACGDTSTNSIASTGPADVAGRSYKSIVQDMVDGYAWAQYDSAPQGGGWRYDPNTEPDNSICQWVAIGFIPAERDWGCKIGQWVKDWNLVWLKYSQNANTGTFGYTSASPAAGWGYLATTPSGMVQLLMDGVSRGMVLPGEGSLSRWDITETYLRSGFNNHTGNADNSIKDYYYGLFSLVKAMLLYNTAPLTNGITYLESKTPGVPPIDWYGDLTNGVARLLIDDQTKTGTASGSWWAHNQDDRQYPLETAMAIVMLNRTVWRATPVAQINVNPNPALPDQPVTLDGSFSYHKDASKHIDSWEWDVNCDGTIDGVGPKFTTTFPLVGNYCVSLRVTDNGSPGIDEQEALVTDTVKIVPPPVPPTAHAGGPYNFCLDSTPWYLDARLSSNPDDGVCVACPPTNCEPDRIVEYAWDLDGDNDFNDAFGEVVDVTAHFQARGIGGYKVQLRIRDNTSKSFPCLATNDLVATAPAEVRVLACECATLTATCLETNVHLSWNDVGAAYYHLYRSTVSHGPYSFHGLTVAGETNFWDTSVVPKTTYYYVVRPAELNTHEICQSKEASARPFWGPLALCRDVAVPTDAGRCYATVLPSQVDAGSFDPDGDFLGLALVPPGPYPVGMTLVTLAVTDQPPPNSCQSVSLNSSCPARIVVFDSQPPMIVCPSNIVQATDPGKCLAIVRFAATASDDCTNVTVVCRPPPGSEFPKGATAVICTATDGATNTAECGFTVTVEDLEPPAITCPDPVTVSTDPGQCYASGVNLGTPTSSDNCAVASVQNNAPAQLPPGLTTVTWTVTDASGNTHTCVQTVTVQDLEPPAITCPAPVTVSTDPGQCYASGVNLGTPTSSDNCAVASVQNNAPAQLPPGLTTVTWTVTDASGNTHTCAQTVIVEDRESPVVLCPSRLTVSADPGQCKASAVALGGPGVSDNCGGTTLLNDAPAEFAVGVTPVVWRALDPGGNVGICTQLVEVVDTEAPMVRCSTNMLVKSGSVTGQRVDYAAAEVTDNCPGAMVWCVPPSGSMFSNGVTLVRCTATDTSGNSSVCSFEVKVGGARSSKELVLAELVAMRATALETADGEKLAQAIEHLVKSLDPDLWLDENYLERKRGSRVFKEESAAAHELEKLQKEDKSRIPEAVLRDWIDRLVEADRTLALTGIQAAEAAGAPPKKIEHASKEIDQANEELVKGHHAKAIDHLEHAWRIATHGKITQFKRLPDGWVRLEFVGDPGVKYQIEASSNLVDWVVIGTITADADGLLSFEDSLLPRTKNRFYRVTELAP